MIQERRFSKINDIRETTSNKIFERGAQFHAQRRISQI